MKCRSVPLLSIHRNPHASGHQLFALEPVPHTGLAGKCTIARPPAVAFDGDTLEILHNIRAERGRRRGIDSPTARGARIGVDLMRNGGR